MPPYVVLFIATRNDLASTSSRVLTSECWSTTDRSGKQPNQSRFLGLHSRMFRMNLLRFCIGRVGRMPEVVGI